MVRCAGSLICVAHADMTFTRSPQGHGQGHGASECPKIALFKVYLLRKSATQLQIGG